MSDVKFGMTFAEAAQRMAEFGKQAGISISRFAEQMRRATASVRALRLSLRDRAIAAYGPGNETAAGEWLSDLCAAWVHESCPSGFCDCHCHGERNHR